MRLDNAQWIADWECTVPCAREADRERAGVVVQLVQSGGARERDRARGSSHLYTARAFTFACENSQ